MAVFSNALKSIRRQLGENPYGGDPHSEDTDPYIGDPHAGDPTDNPFVEDGDPHEDLQIGRSISQNYEFLKHLASLHSPKNRDKMLNVASEIEIEALLDATFIILKPDGFGLSKKQKGKLRPYMSLLRRLTKAKDDDQVRSIVKETGGAFLPFLLNPILQKLEQDEDFMQALEAEESLNDDSENEDETAEDDIDSEEIDTDVSDEEEDYSNIYDSDEEELS